MNLPLFPAKAVFLLLVPVIAGLALAWFALVRIEGAEREAVRLASASAGAVLNVQSLERRVLLSAYSLRGFVASGEKNYLDRAKSELAEAMLAMHALKKAAQAANLPAEKDGAAAAWTQPSKPTKSGDVDPEKTAVQAPGVAASAPGAQTQDPGEAADAEPSALGRTGYLFEAYKKQAEMTVALYESLNGVRHDFEAAAAAFQDALQQAQATMRAAVDQGLAVKYPVIEKIKLLLVQEEQAGQAAASGARINDAYRQARQERRPALLGESMQEFRAASQALASLAGESAIGEADLAKAQAALAEYQAQAQALLGEWQALEGAGEKLLRDEKAVIEATSALAALQARDLGEKAGALSSSLSWSRGYMLAAGAVFGLLGLVWTALGAVALAGPMVRCSRFARALVKGDLRPTLAVTGQDEAGTLADALREIARRMGRSFAR